MGTPRVAPILQTAILTSALTLLSAPVPAQGQDSFAAPAHIDFVDGHASLEREGQLEPVDAGMLFITGDRLRTTTGRVEVIFPDGSVLDVDEYSSVDLQDSALLRLTGGRLLLTVAGADDPARAALYQIDTPVASATTDGPGEYRVAVLSNPTGLVTELAVTRGLASLSTEGGTTPVRAGQRSLAREFESPSYPQAFNSARFDAFDEWAAAQRDVRLGTVDSNQYLPSELQMYGGVLDRSGSWSYNSSYGYVWYPSVGATWRPYYSGYWNAIRPYGWTWIGADPWAWPTHHYGRWGYGGARWYWIPHNRWSPAWVSWGVSADYVGWSPLGFNNRPLFNLSVSIGNRWDGWVVVPNGYFNGRRTHVRHHAVAPYSLRAETFVTQAVAPVAPRYAVPRQRGGGATASVGGARPRGDRGQRAEPRTQASQSPELGASGRGESGRAVRRAAAQSSATTGRQPLTRTPVAAARSTGTARESAAGTAGTAGQRSSRSAVRPGSGVTGASAARSVRRAEPAARRQPTTRARQPIARSPQASTAGRPPRAAVARRPQVSSAGRSSTPGPTTNSTDPPRGAIERNSRGSARPDTPRNGSGVRSEAGRARSAGPATVARQPAGSTRGRTGSANQPRQASTPSAASGPTTAPRLGVGRTGRSGSHPPAPQQASPRARARSPQGQASSGGRASAPARAVSRNRGDSSGAGAPARSRAQASTGSRPARAPAARRGR